MASRADHAANAWLAMESRGRAFEASGHWGHAHGTITPPAAGVRRGWLMGGTRSQASTAVVLVVPNSPEIERLDRIMAIEDAMSAGLSRGGAHVVRVRECTLAGSVFDDADLAVEAALGMADAAGEQVPGARLGLAGVWLAGAVAACASARREDGSVLVMVAAPAPEVMSRRTPENEDDDMWTASPTLRLADALSTLGPLEQVALRRRPTLVVQGAVDDELPAANLEAWRTALTEAGRPVDALEVGFADALLQWRDEDGALLEGAPQAHDLLADAVSRWTIRALRSR